jgi:hypothetical protein
LLDTVAVPTTQPLTVVRALLVVSALLTTGSPAALGLAECPPVAPIDYPFKAGERFAFKLDVYGADVGTFDIWIEAPPPADRGRAQFQGRSRARTSAFLSTSISSYEVRVAALIGKGLLPIVWREELEDGPVHWETEITFPARDGKLPFKSTRNGDPAPYDLFAGPAARDLLSGFLVLRASKLVQGTPLCIDVYAGRRVWRMAGAVGPREVVEGPMGKRDAVRFDLISTRLDEPTITRAVKLWVSDDAKRLPLAAIGEMRGKMIRMQLSSVK